MRLLSYCCRSLGFWRRVDLKVNAEVSEKHAVSMFEVEVIRQGSRGLVLINYRN
jgi:hypothetical protein